MARIPAGRVARASAPGMKTLMEPGGATQEPNPTPRFRNPAAEPDSSPGKQSELKLNVGIGIIGTVLSLFSAVIFSLVIEELVLGIVFVVVTIGAAVLTARFYSRLKKGRAASSE